jgi:hypothetical protein
MIAYGERKGHEEESMPVKMKPTPAYMLCVKDQWHEVL